MVNNRRDFRRLQIAKVNKKISSQLECNLNVAMQNLYSVICRYATSLQHGIAFSNQNIFCQSDKMGYCQQERFVYTFFNQKRPIVTFVGIGTSK